MIPASSTRALEIEGVRRGVATDTERAPARWSLDTFQGRLVEISGHRTGAPLTFAFRLVVEAQRRAEPVAWISRRDSVFFPPDVALTGVDLGALVVIWAADARSGYRAADMLLRSTAFGLVVMDLEMQRQMSLRAQTRLSALAKKSHAALICLTEKEPRRPSLGSLVSLRMQAERTRRVEEGADRFFCEARALKDKCRGPGWSHREVFRGPAGLR